MKSKKVLISLLSLVVVFAGIFGFNSLQVFANNENIENKIYCTATINEDFDDSSVLVVMSKEENEISKLFHGVSVNRLHRDFLLKNDKFLICVVKTCKKYSFVVY